MTETPGTALDVLVQKAIEKINAGTVTMSDLLTTVAPRPAGVRPPAHLPMPAAITDEERQALARLPEVFGQVVPTERRLLQPTEITALVEEKGVLDRIKKMVEKRMGNVRTTLFNHFDVEFEQSGADPDTVPLDKDGHYVTDATARPTSGTTQTLKRETRGNPPTISPTDLLALVENPAFPEFTHEDYLAMTEQVRVVEENKFMLHLKKRPALVKAIAAATKPGTKTASLNLRAMD